MINQIQDNNYVGEINLEIADNIFSFIEVLPLLEIEICTIPLLIEPIQLN